MLHTITLPTPFEVGPINVYLLEGPELTLVDTGARTSRTMDALREGLAAHGYAVADLRRIIITHAHADHFGLAARIVAESGARVLTHRRNLHWLTDFQGEWVRRYDFYAPIFEESGLAPELRESVRQAGDATSRFGDSVAVSGTLDEGDVLTMDGMPWQVLYTPGHAGGLICLYQPDRRLLLSSDHLLKHITSNPLLEPPAPGDSARRRSLVEYLASLRRVAGLDVSLALPGHGEPIGDHRALITERFAFHGERQMRILSLLGNGGKTAYEIALSLWPDLSPLSMFLAISEVIGHMDVLEDEGRIDLVRTNGLLRYAVA